MTKMLKSFAVSPEPLKRAEAYSPRSSDWTLYRPDVFCADLANLSGAEIALPDCEEALERSGFIKAVRQREELIKWKERLRIEQREITSERETLQARLREVKSRESLVREMLENIRNILRISRETPIE